MSERAPLGERPGEPEEQRSSIGWGRAALSAVAILAIGALLLVVLPNWVLGHLSGPARDGRVAIATVAFVVAFVLMAWGLRRLQARRVI